MNSIKIITDVENVRYYLNHCEFHPLLNRFREAEEQQKALTQIIKNEGTMCIAIDNRTIAGYTLIVHPEENERWSYLDYIRILGVLEVAPPYRGQGIAKKVVNGILEDKSLENYIILSLEYAWHWDLKMVEGNIETYKELLKGVLHTGGFKETITDEPDIAQYQHNFLMARFGEKITPDQVNEFMRIANLNSIF
ncbi:GNAT family N-acetyltransferase [Bacillus sp. FJAT-45350]|uniref:GNAT family N-acetyltransferase n=1 Tax=Bacillus sp. FJAT-45350 TaxID=2011014 RepID=UPI000BB77857|nr:GNAT family N-acetyltransferase [Bacillus sp. FJAT-45350]